MKHNLAVICVYWNPAGWRSLEENYLRFRHEMRWWKVPTFAVEVVYEGQEFPTNKAFLQIRAGSRNILWQKERLINLLEEKLPEAFDRIVWIDSDIIILDRNWTLKLNEALDRKPVVQLFGRINFLDSNGKIEKVTKNVGEDASSYLKCTWKPGEVFSSPGGAWAARREVFPLYDRDIVGGGDSMELDAWTEVNNYRLSKLSEKMKTYFMDYRNRSYNKVNGKIAVIDGDVFHMYHGKREKRKYSKRWDILTKCNYDPYKHVEIDESGLLAWTDSAPKELVDHMVDFFSSREEDEDFA